jgi:hypothetical protein
MASSTALQLDRTPPREAEHHHAPRARRSRTAGACAPRSVLEGMALRPDCGDGGSLTNDERDLFTQLTQRVQEPLERVEELWAIVGRRGGKTRAAAALAAYLAACVNYNDQLAIGERGLVLCLAQNQKQANVSFSYIAGLFRAIPALAELVEAETADTLRLSNNIEIEVRAASFRGLRGVTAVAVIADEAAFWAADGSANPDTEILNAVRPSLATTGGPLVVISSPHARRGEVWKTYRSSFGPNGDPRILVLQGKSRDLNPTLPQAVVDRALERDRGSAAAEYLAEFRTDLEAFVAREVVEAAVDPGVFERPPIEGVIYYGFTDPSGGSADAMTVAIAHLDAQTLTLDALREFTPPFSPEAVVYEISQLLSRYRVGTVTGDRYAGEWPREAFARHRISYRTSDRTRSDIYRDLLPALNSRTVALLDSPKLVAQLCSLERRTSRGGRDLIDHAPGQHDDLINAAAGALLLATPRPNQDDDINIVSVPLNPSSDHYYPFVAGRMG